MGDRVSTSWKACLFSEGRSPLGLVTVAVRRFRDGSAVEWYCEKTGKGIKSIDHAEEVADGPNDERR